MPSVPIPWRNWPSVEDRTAAWIVARTIPDRRIKLDDTHVAIIKDRTYPIRRIGLRYSLRGRKERTVVAVFRDQIVNGKEDSLEQVKSWGLQEAKWELYCLGRGWIGVEHP